MPQDKSHPSQSHFAPFGILVLPGRRAITKWSLELVKEVEIEATFSPPQPSSRVKDFEIEFICSATTESFEIRRQHVLISFFL